MVWGVAFICVWGLAAGFITGAQLDDTARHLDIYRKVMLKGVMVFLTVTWVCFRRKSASLVFIALAAVGAVACLDVIAGYGLNYITAENRGAVHTILNRESTLISCPSNSTSWLFFVALAWRAASKRGLFWPVYAASILVLVASFLTISRAGWLGAVGGLFFLFFFARGPQTAADRHRHFFRYLRPDVFGLQRRSGTRSHTRTTAAPHKRTASQLAALPQGGCTTAGLGLGCV